MGVKEIHLQILTDTGLIRLETVDEWSGIYNLWYQMESLN